jgi:hypothetical protein
VREADPAELVAQERASTAAPARLKFVMVEVEGEGVGDALRSLVSEISSRLR